MNEITLLRDAGPEAPPLRPAALQSARAALLDEIAASRTVRGRLLTRRVALRLGVGVTVAATAWTAAVVIAAPDEVGPPPGSVTLVAFDPPAFPLALDPVPAGLTPSFSGDPGNVLHAGYGSADGADRVSLDVTPDEPDLADPSDEQDVTVRGRDAEVVTENVVSGTEDGGSEVHPQVAVLVEWSEDQWVKLTGGGRYDDRDRLLAVARTIVDRPQRVPLQVHLAPAGWSVLAYKDDRILTLVNDAYERQTVDVFLPEQAIPAHRLLHELMGPPVAPVVDVELNGRPAQLVRITARDAADVGWYLQARFADGTTFVVQAPQAFTQEQVLQFAAQVTYGP
jgi:hypothetical protein